MSATRIVGSPSPQIHQRRDVGFWNDDDVYGPKWPRVAEGEYIVGFKDDVHRCLAAQHLLAVEVVGHVGTLGFLRL